MKKFVLGLGVFLVSFCACGDLPKKVDPWVLNRPSVEFTFPKDKITKVVLKNGMTVLVFEQKHFPKVVLQIAYDVGSGIEQSGERGLAHLLEHMIFKGTDKLSEGDIEAISRKYGANDNAFTWYDLTSYFFEVNKNNWQPFMEILSDCMANARFEEEHLASEMKAVIQELRMGNDNYMAYLGEKAFKNIFPANHPYHDPIIGYKEDLLSLSAKNLRKFYKKYYGPDKAVLFVVGDVRADEIIAQAKTLFEKIPRGQKLPEQVIPQDGVDVATQLNKLYRDITKPFFGFYWRIPGLKAKNMVLTSAVEDVLSGGEGSLLYRRLVDEEKIANSVDVSAVQLKHAGVFFIGIEPKEGFVDKCREVLKEELEKVINKDFDEKALTKVVRSAEHSFIVGLQSNFGVANSWVYSYLATGDEYEIFNRIKDYARVDKEDISNFVKTYLDPFFMNELQLLPIPEDKKEIWLKNKTRSEELDREILKKYQRTAPLEEPVFSKNMPAPKPLELNFPKPDRVVLLKNGLKIILKKMSNFPLINVLCKFKESDYLSTSKQSVSIGIMMGNLMEASTGGSASIGYSKKDNVDFFELLGAGYGFGPGGASFSTVNVGFKKLLKRWHHIMTKPNFGSQALEKIKNIAIDSLQKQKDNPNIVAGNILNTMIYKNHPYGYSIDDSIEIVKNLTLRDLKKLHKKYVSPKNMVMFVVGDFDLDEVEKDISQVCGSWSGGDYIKPDLGKGAFVPNERRDKVMLRDQVILMYGRPSPLTLAHPDRIPLKLLNNICFDGLGSRLGKLRERTGLFYGASGALAARLTKVHGYDFIGAMLSVDRVKEAQEKMLEVVDEMGKNGVAQSELEEARQYYLNGLINHTATIGGVAGSFSFIEEYNLPTDYFDKSAERVQSITRKEVNQIAKRYFNSKDLARVRVGRIDAIRGANPEKDSSNRVAGEQSKTN